MSRRDTETAAQRETRMARARGPLRDGMGDEGAHLGENQRRRLYRRAGDRCERCGICEADGLDTERVRNQPFLPIHHVVRVVDGGTDDDENLVVLCNPCHREWHGLAWRYLTHDEWMKIPPYRELIR